MNIVEEIKIEKTRKDFFKQAKTNLKSVSKAIEEVAKEFNITNRQVIYDVLDYESYVEFLIEEKVIPDINRYDFIEKNFDKEYLNSVGDAWLK